VLEGLIQLHIGGGTLCRFANVRRRLEALRALGLAPEDLNEVLTFLNGDGDPEELLDAPSRHFFISAWSVHWQGTATTCVRKRPFGHSSRTRRRRKPIRNARP
jgi:hypothetical protein